MSGRLYERISTGRFGSERSGRRRGARDIDVAVANRRSTGRTSDVPPMLPSRIG